MIQVCPKCKKRNTVKEICGVCRKRELEKSPYREAGININAGWAKGVIK